MRKAFALGVWLGFSILTIAQTNPVVTTNNGTNGTVPVWSGTTPPITDIENTDSTHPAIVGGNLAVKGPKPWADVTAYGAMGDGQWNGFAYATDTMHVLLSSGVNQFSLADCTSTPGCTGKTDKTIFINTAVAHAPIPLSGIVTVASGSIDCPNGANLDVSRTERHAYLRFTELKSGLEGDPSVEVFVAIPKSSTKMCLKIDPSKLQMVNSPDHYNIYAAIDDGDQWLMSTVYAVNTVVIDSNGMREKVTAVTSDAKSGSMEPVWCSTFGCPTTDNHVTWQMIGPPAIGLASGTEQLQNMAPLVINHPAEIDTIKMLGSLPPSHWTSRKITFVPSPTQATLDSALPNTFASSATADGNMILWGTDDWGSINAAQAAITPAVGPNSGGTVFFPESAGCYLITQSLVINGNGTTNNYFEQWLGGGAANGKNLFFPNLGLSAASEICTGMSFPMLVIGTSSAALAAGPLINNLGFHGTPNTEGCIQLIQTTNVQILDSECSDVSNGYGLELQTPSGASAQNQYVSAYKYSIRGAKFGIQFQTNGNNGQSGNSFFDMNIVGSQNGGGACVSMDTSDNNNYFGRLNCNTFPIAYSILDAEGNFFADVRAENTAVLTSDDLDVAPNIIGSQGSGTAFYFSGNPPTKCFGNQTRGLANSFRVSGVITQACSYSKNEIQATYSLTANTPNTPLIDVGIGDGGYYEDPIPNSSAAGQYGPTLQVFQQSTTSATTYTPGIAQCVAGNNMIADCTVPSLATSTVGAIGIATPQPANSTAAAAQTEGIGSLPLNSSSSPLAGQYVCDSTSGTNNFLVQPAPCPLGQSEGVVTLSVPPPTTTTAATALIDRSVHGPQAFVNVTTITKNANTTGEQDLQTITIPANYLNQLGKTLHIFSAGRYLTRASQVPKITIKVRWGSTSTPLVSWTSSASTALSSNAFNFDLYVSTQANPGPSASIESHGTLRIALTNTAPIDSKTYSDTNATLSGFDVTTQQILKVTISFETQPSGCSGSACNQAVGSQLVAQVID